MILIIDNYDSFTYNLYQYIGELSKEEIKVIRNDAMSVDEILKMDYSKLVISPGPGRPENAGICIDLIKRENKRPVLGVCLGHQAICEAFGVKVTYAKKLYHGKKSFVNIEKKSRIFNDLGKRIEVGRYHSLSADTRSDFSNVNITARTDDGEIMSVEHKYLNIFGIQFHPESVLTECGKKLLKNFLEV